MSNREPTGSILTLKTRIAALEHAEAERKRAEKDKETIAVISRLLLSSQQSDSFYDDIVREIINRFGFTFAVLTLYDQAASEFIVIGAAGNTQPIQKPVRVPSHLTLCGLTLGGETIIASNTNCYSKEQFPYLHAEHLQSMVCIPMMVEGQNIGTITLGDRVSHDIDPSLVDTLKVIADILAQGIERRRIENERLHLATAVEQSAETIMITDTNGIIQYVNPAFVRITGYTREEAIGNNPRFLKSREHNEEFYRKMWETISSGEIWTGHFINKTKSGHLFEEEATISPIRNVEGKIVNYVAVKRDVTQEVALEYQLRQAQKMEAIGQLAGGVAHDFNNILQAILGYSQIALNKLAPDEKSFRELMEIRKASERATSLTRQLLSFSRRQIIQPVDLKLNQIIVDLANMLRRIIGEHIELHLYLNDELKTIHADAGMIEQALMNLCVNARDAMPHGGTLTIETDNVVMDSECCKPYPWAKPGEYVCLTVSDNGIGMSHEIQNRLFEPFFTTKDHGKGTGLGLATVYGNIKQHGGMIHVYSETGKGSSFKIYLPSTDRAPIQSEKQLDIPAPGGTETILVAEDEDMVRELAARILRNHGYTVYEAKDGQEAVQLFNEHRQDIMLVVLDVVMPKLSGRRVHDKIKEIKSDTGVLFCSGYSINSIHTNFILKEGFHLLQKPYTEEGLLHKVRYILNALQVS